uniref:Uncharacterized protein n=1 Tax=Megaselia scalaris TaxID=36166 RepID=T1GFB0_MEGSC
MAFMTPNGKKEIFPTKNNQLDWKYHPKAVAENNEDVPSPTRATTERQRKKNVSEGHQYQNGINFNQKNFKTFKIS